MRTSIISNRHTAKSGIHGEWSNRTHDRPIKTRDLLGGAVVLGLLYLAMCVGAASGF